MTTLPDEVREAIEDALVAWMTDAMRDNCNGYAGDAEVDDRSAKVEAVRAWLNKQAPERKDAK